MTESWDTSEKERKISKDEGREKMVGTTACAVLLQWGVVVMPRTKVTLERQEWGTPRHWSTVPMGPRAWLQREMLQPSPEPWCLPQIFKCVFWGKVPWKSFPCMSCYSGESRWRRWASETASLCSPLSTQVSTKVRNASSFLVKSIWVLFGPENFDIYSLSYNQQGRSGFPKCTLRNKMNRM